jgi:RNA-directed DNA polymerase
MKSKEEPSIGSESGNPSSPADRHIPGRASVETTGSVVRQDGAAPASIEKPALGLFAESLMEAVVEQANVERAWRNVKANRGAPGPDGVSLTEFPAWFRLHWPTVRSQLLDGTYRPSPVRRVTIDKPDGGKRQLGIPNVLDRLIQQAVVQVLTPIFDPGFSDSSHGFRPNRSAHGAAKQVRRTIRIGYRFVVDMDLSKFFDRVQHDVLMSRVGRKVRDKLLLKLIGRYLRAGVMVDGVLQATLEGTPQGGPISNLYLSDLDHRMAALGYEMVRYADDLVILCRSQDEAESALEEVQRFVASAGLTLHPEKTRIVDSRETSFDFLGYSFRWKFRFPRAKSRRKMIDRIRQLTPRKSGQSLTETIVALNAVTTCWFTYFRHCNWNAFDDYDGMIRRRLRRLLLKRHRLNPKRLPRTLRWPNAYFTDLGFRSLRDAHTRYVQSLQLGNH